MKNEWMEYILRGVSFWQWKENVPDCEHDAEEASTREVLQVEEKIIEKYI